MFRTNLLAERDRLRHHIHTTHKTARANIDSRSKGLESLRNLVRKLSSGTEYEGKERGGIFHQLL
jgi:hypothetical protein